MHPLAIDSSYILASILFIFGLKMLSSLETARTGNLVSALGMLVAVVATLKEVLNIEVADCSIRIIAMIIPIQSNSF